MKPRVEHVPNPKKPATVRQRDAGDVLNTVDTDGWDLLEWHVPDAADDAIVVHAFCTKCRLAGPVLEIDLKAVESSKFPPGVFIGRALDAHSCN